MTICYSIGYSGLIRFYYGSDDQAFRYLGYTFREAEKLFRRAAGLRYKHIDFVQIPA